MYYQFSKDEVEPYCEKDGCDWTQKYYCPWDIFNPSTEEAKDDGSLGYYACCVYRLHPAEACGYSVIYKDSVVQNGKHIISTDPEITRNLNARQLIASRSNTNPINYCDYVCQYEPRGTKNKDYDPCDLFLKDMTHVKRMMENGLELLTVVVIMEHDRFVEAMNLKLLLLVN